MAKNRAIRRHHYNRLKEKRKRYWNNNPNIGLEAYLQNNSFYGSNLLLNKIKNGRDYDSRNIGMIVNTPKNCSCSICRNKRNNKWNSEKEKQTRQELANELKFEEGLGEYDEYLQYLEDTMYDTPLPELLDEDDENICFYCKHIVGVTRDTPPSYCYCSHDPDNNEHINWNDFACCGFKMDPLKEQYVDSEYILNRLEQ